MVLYQYRLDCGHRKITPDKRDVGTQVHCNSCAQRNHPDRRIVTDVDEIGQIPVADQEDTRG